MQEDGRILLRDGRAQHIRTVLRAAPRDTVRLGILNGPCGEGEVLEVADDSVTLASRFDTSLPGRPFVDLLLAMPRPKVMKRLWAPLASMGLGRIMITNAARVERNYFDTHWLDHNNYEPLLVEGLQQAGMTRLPEVTVARRFRPLIEDRLSLLSPDTLRVVAHPHDAESLAAVLEAEPGRRLLLAVGPEGGWVPFELDLMRATGFLPVALPFGALRTDVACIALLGAVGALRGEAMGRQREAGAMKGSVS